jgi:thiamine-phosphate pyrophosphorylase
LLYYITGRNEFSGYENVRRRAVLAKIAEAARAGVEYIQLREKDLSTREIEKLAREAVAAIRENSAATRLIVNSRTDIALAVGANGVHLRSDDVAPREARRIVEVSERRPISTDHFLVAASCHSAEDVLRAESEGADFAVFAPVFEKKDAPSHLKTNRPPAGIAALREACRAKVPVLALGGVTVANAASCLDAGAAGMAGIRLFQENKIEDVVRALRAL